MTRTRRLYTGIILALISLLLMIAWLITYKSSITGLTLLGIGAMVSEILLDRQAAEEIIQATQKGK